LHTDDELQFAVTRVREKSGGKYGDEWLIDIEGEDIARTISFTKQTKSDNPWRAKAIMKLQARLERDQKPYRPVIVARAGKALTLRTAPK
jgi:hypothetical protein